jgi:homoserine trans-succinylase
MYDGIRISEESGASTFRVDIFSLGLVVLKQLCSKSVTKKQMISLRFVSSANIQIDFMFSRTQVPMN